MTDTAHLDVLDRSVEKANIWINDVATELGTTDRHEAYRALRAFLHVLRDRLPVAETAQLSAQLPLLVRGVFYENWRPAGTPGRSGRRDRVTASHVSTSGSSVSGTGSGTGLIPWRGASRMDSARSRMPATSSGGRTASRIPCA